VAADEWRREPFVLSDQCTAGSVPAPTFLLTQREIDAFCTAAATLDVLVMAGSALALSLGPLAMLGRHGRSADR
jgi:hypothetical protein